MAAPLSELAVEYNRHEQQLRTLLSIDAATIVGGTADAVLLSMRGVMRELAKEVRALERSLEQFADDAAEADRLAQLDQNPPDALPDGRRCTAISGAVTYTDLKLERTSRTRCDLPAGHDGEHAATLGNGRRHEWA